jgi:Cdc6-like AAA superfamily ATPase
MPNKSPDDVFTPRAPRVNDPMYIKRPTLERALVDALEGHVHIIIHGESGTGKSWLYKRVLAEMGATVVNANLANASRLGSIQAELRNLLERDGTAIKTGYSEKKSAEVNAVVAKGSLDHTGNFSIGSKEPLEACFQRARTDAGSKLACIVLDNLEQAFDNEAIMKELADTLVLLDDERYAQYKVKLVIVGVPSGMKEYFSKTRNLPTISNRLREIPEVSRLTHDQTDELVKRGFVDELQMQATDDIMNAIVNHVRWVTDRIPQRIHEYCLELAKIAKRNGNVLTKEMLIDADRVWLGSSLSADYTVIEAAMNAKETKIGRKNQCIFALGLIEKDEFKASDIETIVRQQFPTTTEKTTLNVPAILGDLAKKEGEPIIKKTSKGDAYAFKDPKYRMCIRAMLTKTADGSISKRDLGSV